jgi:hypothetical protein
LLFRSAGTDRAISAEAIVCRRSGSGPKLAVRRSATKYLPSEKNPTFGNRGRRSCSTIDLST